MAEIAMIPPMPTDSGRPREVAAARAINYIMITLIIAAMAGLSAWMTYDQILLAIQARGVRLGEHLQHILFSAEPFFLGVGFWIAWRRKPRARRAGH